MTPPPESRRSRLLHDSYLVGLTVQGLIGAGQLFFATVLQIAIWAGWLEPLAHFTGHLLERRAADPMADWLMATAHDLSVGSDMFWSIYLFGHGVLNLGVVIALLAKKRWAHPASMIVLAGFVGYQMYRYTLSHSLVMIALSAFDVVVISLVWREYRQLQRARRG
ncbi:MAG: DUF2127 domain-containing protein [Rhodobacteraceae bacterium]|nr:DUF2127 domain-containing protein [Paracoccaceae bacterium]